MRPFSSALVLAFIMTGSVSHAIPKIAYQTANEKTGIGLPPAKGISILSEIDDYRVGDEWGKRQVTSDNLKSETPAFQRAARATARVGGATGFVLGRFNGEIVVATNYHVMKSANGCRGSRVRFPLLGVEGNCERFIGSWTDIDLALFVLRAKSEGDAAKILEVAANFSFQNDVNREQKLLTVGFGVADNEDRNLMANQDSDCYVFSQTGEYRFMADPDKYNPGSYQAWSFAVGCDVSHGDSGSAMVDRETSQVLGIIWTGNIPKSSFVQNSKNLQDLFQRNDGMIWEELNYAVPAKKIGEHLRSQVDRGSLSSKDLAVLKALLGL